jgi:hypothetical protein
MQQKITLIIFFVIATIFGLILAVDIGQANYEQLGIYATIGIILYFFIHGWRNVWWFTALLIFSGVVFYQGFFFEADHLFVMMLCLASFMSLLSRGTMSHPPEFRLAGSRSTSLAVGLLVSYGAAHFLVNYAFPYSPTDYALKTAAKAYFECYASMVCFLWLMIGPYGFTLKPTWTRSLIYIIVFALIGNVAARGFMYLIGFQAADGLSTGGMEDYYLHVPVINMQAGIYTLRNLSPTACVILLMIATAPGWWSQQRPLIKLVVLGAIGLCVIGAVFSGGRATLLFCIAIFLLVALVRRRVALLALMGMSCALIVAVVNLFSDQINTSAPHYIARSLQMVMWDKGEAVSSIEGSQETRNAAIQEALKEFRKDNRVLFFGRSVFLITHEDALVMRNKGIDGFVQNAMRSGRTHNLITDLLLQYGIIGCLLYLVAYISVIRMYIKLSKAIPYSETVAKALAGAMAIYLSLMLPYQLLGGTFMPAVAALMIGLIRVQLVRHRVGLPATASVNQATADRARLTPARGLPYSLPRAR